MEGCRHAAAYLKLLNGKPWKTNAVFCKNYLIESLSAWNGNVILTLKENDQLNAVNRAGEEAVELSFF